MAAGDEDVRTMLDAVAEQAGALRVTRAGVERAVRRRRTAHASYGAVAVAAVASIGLAVPLSLTGGGAGVSGPGAVDGTGPVQAHAPACGAPILQPTVGTADPGLRLTVTDVTRDATGRPAAATVTLSATAEVRLGILGPTPLQVLLLLDGAVVDRLGTYGITSSDPVTDWIAIGPDGAGGRAALGRSQLVSPTSPWVVRVGGPRHCPPTSASPGGGYTLIAVMSVPRSDEWPGAGDLQDPLLVSAPVPLSGG
jgi:hypothetical protein